MNHDGPHNSKANAWDRVLFDGSPAGFVCNLFHTAREFKPNLRCVFQLFIPIIFIRYGWRWMRYEGPGFEDTANVSFPELRDSAVEAKRTVPYFIVNVSLAIIPNDSKECADGRRDGHEDEVEDWQILMPGGRLKGAYSTIALLWNRQNTGKPLSPEMRKQKELLLDFPA